MQDAMMDDAREQLLKEYKEQMEHEKARLREQLEAEIRTSSSHQGEMV